MMWTHDQSAAIRCCGPEGCGYTVNANGKGPRLCVGLACMAWREVRSGDAVELLDGQPRGYCGLAGKP